MFSDIFLRLKSYYRTHIILLLDFPLIFAYKWANGENLPLYLIANIVSKDNIAIPIKFLYILINFCNTTVHFHKSRVEHPNEPRLKWNIAIIFRLHHLNLKPEVMTRTNQLLRLSLQIYKVEQYWLVEFPLSLPLFYCIVFTTVCLMTWYV